MFVPIGSHISLGHRVLRPRARGLLRGQVDEQVTNEHGQGRGHGPGHNAQATLVHLGHHDLGVGVLDGHAGVHGALEALEDLGQERAGREEG